MSEISTTNHSVTGRPIKGPIISECKVHRMQSSVWRSGHKEPNQCRLELKERLQKRPLVWEAFLHAAFSKHKRSIRTGVSNNSNATHFKRGPLIESLTDGAAERWNEHSFFPSASLQPSAAGTGGHVSHLTGRLPPR